MDPRWRVGPVGVGAVGDGGETPRGVVGIAAVLGLVDIGALHLGRRDWLAADADGGWMVAVFSLKHRPQRQAIKQVISHSLNPCSAKRQAGGYLFMVMVVRGFEHAD